MSRYLYKAFGLILQIDIECPELTAMHSDAQPNVVIESGEIPEQLIEPKIDGVRYQATDTQFLLHVDRVAGFMAVNGEHIFYEKFPDATFHELRYFLLGSVITAILHQRNTLTLHAGAIKVNSHCVLFCGHTGDGKSAITSIFLKRDYGMHSDDISVIGSDDSGYPVVYPGMPMLYLWKDTLPYNGIKSDSLHPVRHGLEKYAIPVHQQFSSAALPVKRIYILSPHNINEFTISELNGVGRFNSLKNHIHRFNYLTGLKNEAEHFKRAADLGQQVSVKLVNRPRKPVQFDELADFLEKDFLK